MAQPAQGGVRFLICPDAQLIRQEIDARLDPEVRRKVYWGDDDPPLGEDFWTNLTIKGLFAEPKALVLRKAQALTAALWDKLQQAAPRPGSDVTLFLCLEGQWNKNAPAVPAVLKKRPLWTGTAKENVWQSPGLTRKTVQGFVENFARERGLAFAPGGLQAAAQALPLDARAARLELEKIALAAGPDPAGPELADLITPHEEMAFFTFLDQLQAGRADLVWERVMADHLKPTGDRMLFPCWPRWPARPGCWAPWPATKKPAACRGSCWTRSAAWPAPWVKKAWPPCWIWPCGPSTGSSPGSRP